MPKFHRIKPVGDQVVILHDKNKSKTGGGIFLPDRCSIPVLTGRILAISAKISTNDYDFPFEVGDQVVYNVTAGVPIDLDPGDKRYLLPASAILGVIQESDSRQDD